jgi:uncharacterized coiled-coil protein SlyX
MQRLDERVAFMEGQMGEQSTMIENVRNTCARLEARIDRLEDRMDHRFEAVDARFDALERKVDHGFVWLVGIQVTTFVAIVVAIAAAVISR